ncbi:MAG: hypothetical protein ABIC04_04110 [Nanoarchaeota archaeon]
MSIDQKTAEEIAKGFVIARVKFFTQEEQTTVVLPQYDFTSVDSYKEGRDWAVSFHIEAVLGNISKGNDISLKINSKGKVTEFNGQKVSP